MEPTRLSTAPTEKTGRGNHRALVAGSIGNAVEFIDWAVYTTFSSVFAHHFFPPGNDSAALLSTLAIFAVGFVVRPIGAAIMGAYADRHGRKKGLVLTIGLMAAATFVIGVSPSYAQVGLAAPIILVIARMAQGFAAGGEFGSASAFLVESAGPGRRAFAGSWQQVSVGAGILIASGMGAIVTSALPRQALESWGWRLAFVVASLFGLAGLWLRRSVEETPSFHRGETRGGRRNALVTMLRQHPKAALRVFGLNIAGVVLYNMWLTYLPTYASVSTHIPLSQALLANVIGLVTFVVLLPFAGMLSDRIGRKPTMVAFAGGFLLLAWPAFRLLNGDFRLLLLVQVAGLVLLLGYSANVAAVMAEQFPPEVRATGIGLPYALSVAVFGGTVPYLTTWLTTNGLGTWVWLYCAIAAAIGLIVYLTMPETKDKDID
ncbi:MFS transporter [Amycolatopsis jiangsuensis]|uniref:Putative proline/betaine transporter n=1 Tax=Amycolatopsis jiangsuensis TaxID=1181879 RepID=A0A840J5I1_9PSEU|nr:MFS transporter [Amycolatopsis jiangsuensis]MBB4689290.1 MHS family alpha-ketoglutarate permease-like MFS transporter [Amycolatopsis jiangsuensis]